MAIDLSNHRVDSARISVSGLSAGAFMAHQLHLAFSDVFCGAGIIAGGPFLCSQHTMWGALTYGLHGMPAPDHVQLAMMAKALSARERLAPLDNLKRARVWLFHGRQDSTVNRSVVDSLAAFYGHFVQSENISYVRNVNVGHAMPVDNALPALNLGTKPYIHDCGYDAAGQLLQHIHGPLNARATPQGLLAEFDQRPFLSATYPISMAETGFVYLPQAALDGKPCGIHVALHGCQQHRDAIGDVFAQHAGYNAWAEANDFIVLYPQACASNNFTLYNPLASWDWWSYTGGNYALRTSSQMCAIVAMVKALGAK